MKSKILIVEDSIEIAKVIKLYLIADGHDVYTAENGLDAWKMCKEVRFDLGIFDLMIPQMDGYELIQEVRKFTDMPILILSAKVEEHSKVLGLKIGADDYITKPFNPVELMARVNASLRRWALLNDKVENSFLHVGELSLDSDGHVLKKNNVEIILTATEFKILRVMMGNPGKVYSKKQICEIVHGEYFETDENAITVHISHIRDKIGVNSNGESYIKTKRGLGYKIEK